MLGTLDIIPAEVALPRDAGKPAESYPSDWQVCFLILCCTSDLQNSKAMKIRSSCGSATPMWSVKMLVVSHDRSACHAKRLFMPSPFCIFRMLAL